jgi:hypothetical protein
VGATRLASLADLPLAGGGTEPSAATQDN